jgi:CheY-like chemotaxis protein
MQAVMENTNSSHHSVNHYSVLIVENDERLLNSLESLAKDVGYDIRATWSGREALALLQSHDFDLVLVDHHLPDIYCGEFLKKASRHSRSIVVLQSGPAMPSRLKRYKTLGAAGVVDRSDPKQIRQLLASRHGHPAHA